MTKPDKSEQKIQKEIINEIERNGGYVIKVVAGTVAGIPDLIACIDGRFLGIEVKKPGNVASPLQLFNIKKIIEAGGIGAVIYNVDELKNILVKNNLKK